ncbi:ankyrin-2 [Staphylotrichum tortipilum]|uniref:Ankyrin-2 n=1 Tax=Staphylotrichum tortipilum TaxID=2831512 RepID=A0AAN6MCR9_9PEZI|nr:ankyrin-2 [Staphylotrichum longicolle]
MDPEHDDDFVTVEARTSPAAAADNNGMDMDMDMDTDMDVIGSDDIHTYNPANILPRPPDVLLNIRKWLDPTPYDHEGGEYRRHLASHAPGTGQWLTDSETYRKWHAAEPHGLLWIKGIPGSGKSVFAAILADALAREGHPVLFFFFRQIIDANHEPVQMLRDWLAQLLDHSPPLQRDLEALALRDFRPVRTLGHDELWTLLKTGLAHLPRVYLVADALDEMRRGNDDWLRALAGAAMWDPARVKVLITSRPVDRVETPLRGFPILRIRLEERLVDTDIAKYVQLRLTGDEAGAAISAQDRVLIEEAVPGRANGLFLYAKLAMDGFLAPDAHVRDVLAKLPADLDAMYTNLLAEHARTSGVSPGTQRLLLCWVTHASRPLRLLEMAEMLTTECSHAEGESPSPPDLKSARVLVRAACGPLLQIHPDETVSVVHHSLTEFLLGTTRFASEAAETCSSSSCPFPILMPGPSHEQLAVSCIRYLQFSGCFNHASAPDAAAAHDNDDDSHDGWNTDRAARKHKASIRLRFPFAEYASMNWTVHAAKSFDASPDSPALVSALDGFLIAGARLNAWSGFVGSRNREATAPSCIAAEHGLAVYLEHLIRRDGIPPKFFKSPLRHAAKAGHTAVVRVLLAAGASPEPEDWLGNTPLHSAAANNHAEIVALLVAAGASPLKKTKREAYPARCGRSPITTGSTPLMHACRAGHLATIDALLPWLDETGSFPLALKWATLGQQPKLIKHLLQQPGVDVNVPVDGDTALFNACRRGDIESIEALVLAGANAGVVCPGHPDLYTYLEARYLEGYYRTRGPAMPPLAAFCIAVSKRLYGDDDDGHDTDDNGDRRPVMERGLELLLRAGANLEQLDTAGRPPLHLATNRPALMRLLLRLGADPNAEASDGGTLLHALVHGHSRTARVWDMITLLVNEAHADINKRRRSDGKTPVMLMACGESDLCRRFVAAFKPDCTIGDHSGDTALHHLATPTSTGERASLRVELIDALLAAGAPVDQRNHDGRTALHVAGTWSVIDLLVNRGADLEARDHSGATPLMLHCSRRGDVDHLLSLGARPDTRDFAGRTLLHQALGSHHARHGFQEVFAAGAKLNPNQTDYAGNTALHELVSRQASHGGGSKEFEALLRLGVDPDAVNNAGETVLHLACGHGGQSLVTNAVAACNPKTLELPNHAGLRPIHLAAATSRDTVAEVVRAGADPRATTRNGLTALHVAASVGHPDTVDMLLREMTSVIDTTDRDGVTALYYACLSGKAESVRLLLDAGVEVKPHSRKLLEACSRAEKEASQRASETPVLSSGNEYGTQRRFPGTFDWIASPDHAQFSAELDEILTLLKCHGLDHAGTDEKGRRTHLEAAIDAVYNDDSLGYTLRCLSKFQSSTVQAADDDGQVARGDGVEATQALTDFVRRCTEIRREAATIAFLEHNLAPQVCQDREVLEKLFVRLLERRELVLLESAVCAVGRGNAFLPNGKGWTLLHALVALGQATLLSRLATPDDVARIDDPAWRSDQQILAKVAKYEWCSPIAPLVLAACRRREANILVLRALVDEAGASVNAAEMVLIERSKPYVSGDTPLHVLGEPTCWWQAHEALPFVLARHPDLEARDVRGWTPLHRAISNYGRFGHHVVKLLIEAGADVNAVKASDCVSMAAVVGDTQLIQLLLAHGARINAGAVMAAIESERVAALEVLLAARETPAAEMKQYAHPPSYLVGEDGARALHRAAITPSYYSGCLETRADMVRLLLAHGLDPFGTFRLSGRGDETPVDEPGELCTVLHQVVLQNGVIGPFFELPGLDLERRNSAGQTVLLAACANPQTFTRAIWTDCPTPSDDFDGEESSKEPHDHLHEHRGLIPHLLALGASPSALDAQSHSALHLAITAPAPSHDKPADLATLTSLLAPLILPSVINHASALGTTPLHVALTVLPKTSHCPSSWRPIHEPLVAALLAAGANPYHVNPLTGDGTLHLIGQAVGRCGALVSLMREFVGLGMDVNARNLRGETAVFGVIMGGGDRGREWGKGWGGEEGEEEVWRVLTDIGVDFGVRDCEGRGLLHVVAARGRHWVGMYKRLLEMGLDAAAVDHNQRTSLDVAAACQNEGVLGLFEREE